MSKTIDRTGRVQRAKRVVGVLAGLCIVESCVLGVLGVTPETRDLTGPLALFVGGSGGFLIYQGWPAIDEVADQKIVLCSTSKLYHALQYGLAVAAAGFVMMVHALLHLYVGLPWPASVTSIIASGMPAGLLSTVLLSRRVASWMGLGV